MVEKIIWYLLYLIAFGLYFYAAGIWLKHFNSRLLGTGSFTLINQLGALLGLMPLVLFPWLLTGFFHLDFLFLVFLIAEGTIFLSMVIGFIFQTPTRSIGLRSFIVGTELATTYPKAATIFLHVPRYVFAAIILATSWVYFSHEFHSVEVQKPILLITISLILFQICYQLFNVSLIIFSAGIPDRTRRALFINILVTSIPIGIYLTLLLSFAGLESYYSFIAIPGLVPDILSVPTLILSGFYFLALVVPYLIGSERFRRTELLTFHKMTSVIDSVIEVVGIPNSEEVAKLTGVKHQLDGELQRYLTAEPFARAAAHLSAGSPPANQVEAQYQFALDGLPQLRQEDPRLIYMDFLFNWNTKIDEMIKGYTVQTSLPNALEVAIPLSAQYSSYLNGKMEEYESKLSRTQQRKIFSPIVHLVATLVTTVTSSSGIVELAKGLLDYLK